MALLNKPVTADKSQRLIRFVVIFFVALLQASTGIPPLLCDGQTAAISPSQEVIVTKSRPGTLGCTTTCGKVENLFFYRPSGESRDDINILESNIFSSVVGSVKPSSDSTTMSCSHSVNITWTNDTNIRNELDSVMCVIILKGGVSCKTENISVVFSDLPCTAPPILSPPNGLYIIKNEPNTLSCTVPHQTYEIENIYVVNSDESDILIDAAMNAIITEKVEFVNATTYFLRLLWTGDTVVRKKLDSLQCVVIYHSGSMVCKSSKIHVEFLGTSVAEEFTSQSSTITTTLATPMSVFVLAMYCILQ